MTSFFLVFSLFLLELSAVCGVSFAAFLIVSPIKLQYRSIDLLASSLPGIGKFIPSGFEFVSKIATIGIFNLMPLLLLRTHN